MPGVGERTCWEVAFVYAGQEAEQLRGHFTIEAASADDAIERARVAAGKRELQWVRARRLHAVAEHRSGGALRGTPAQEFPLYDAYRHTAAAT